MCGILGLRRDSYDRACALRALRSLAWRGADDLRLIECGPWWLGVARLAISDPYSPQPVVDRATGVAVAFNGAVTDAGAARQRLPDRGAGLQGGNDAELVLQRFLAAGPRALDAQTGGYAAAVVDPRDGSVHFAVDPCGEKPLYAVDDGRRLVAFASTVRALEEAGHRVALDDDQRARLLRYGMLRDVQSARPRWRRIRVLQPGIHRSGGEGEEPLVTPERDRCAAVVPSGSSLAVALEHGVARCAEAEVPVGLCLSGGIDSACLAVLLARLERRDVVAYQFRADDGVPDDERRRAREVAARCGLRLVEVEGGSSVLDVLPGLTHCHGMPLGDPSVLAVHALARRAAVDGIRVLLSGEGADDLLLGYPRHRAARWLPRRGWPALRTPRGGMGHLARWCRAWSAERPYDALLEATSPAFRHQVLPGMFADAEAGALPAGGEESALHRARFVDREHYLRDDLLPKLDVATLAAGIEGRCPFLDPEVLASVEVNEPDPRRVVGKRALRSAFEGLLPAGHMDQPKRGFGVPMARWLSESRWALELLLDDETGGRPWIDPDGLRQWVADFRAGIGRARADARGLYLVLAMELHDRRADHAPASTEAVV